MAPELQKLRRFALAIGVILITYSLAGVTLEAPAKISPLGIPLTIHRPDLLPAGLALASVYSMLRYIYYGAMLSESPARRRRFWRRKPLYHTPPAVELDMQAWRKRWSEIGDNFPKVMGRIAAHRIEKRDRKNEDGRTVAVESMIPIIPWPVRIAARLEEADYFAPIWVNLLAIALAMWNAIAA